METRRYKVNECITFNSKCKGEEKVLSNMYNYCNIVYDGKLFNSNEQFFSWMSCEDKSVKDAILACSNAFEVKALVKQYEKDNGLKGVELEKRKFRYMWMGLRLKARYCKRFRDYLLMSGNIPLVEYCYWLDRTKKDDEVWGTRFDREKGEYIGYNACGRIMMGIREELKLSNA